MRVSKPAGLCLRYKFLDFQHFQNICQSSTPFIGGSDKVLSIQEEDRGPLWVLSAKAMKKFVQAAFMMGLYEIDCRASKNRDGKPRVINQSCLISLGPRYSSRNKTSALRRDKTICLYRPKSDAVYMYIVVYNVPELCV